ncbi:MAG: LamG domain-containing protein [Fibrobacterales bacterium]
MRTLLLYCFMVCFTILIGCSLPEPGPTAGTTIETTNGIAGVVTTENSTPVAAALISMRPKGYLPSTVGTDSIVVMYEAFSDSIGYFLIDSIADGEYVVEIIASDSLATFFTVTFFGEPEIVEVEPVVYPLSQVSGGLADTTAAMQNGEVKVEAYGFDRSTGVDSVGRFEIDLPAGDHTLRVVYDFMSSEGYDLPPLTTAPGSVVILDSLDKTSLSSSSVIHENVSSSINQEEVESSEWFYVDSNETTSSLVYHAIIDDYFTGDESRELTQDASLFNPQGESYTVLFSFQYSGVVPEHQYILTKGNAENHDEGWSFSIEEKSLFFRVNSSNTMERRAGVYMDVSGLSLDSLSLIVGVVDRQTQTIRCYLNGQESCWYVGGIGTETNSISGFGSISANAPLVVGGGYQQDSAYFSGMVSEIQIYNYALHPEEILNISKELTR